MHTTSFRTTLPEVVIQADCDCAIAQVMLRLAADDVIVRRSFELDSACALLAHNICPHNGHSPCECRLAVLILRDARGHIATRIVHAHGRVTELYWVSSEGLRPDPTFERHIRVALASLGTVVGDQPDTERQSEIQREED